jgi:hypothetical protein
VRHIGWIDDLAWIGKYRDGRQRDRKDLAVAVGDHGPLTELGRLSSSFWRREQSRDWLFRPVRREWLQDGRVSQLGDHREEQQGEAERRIDETVSRLFQCIATLQVRLGDAYHLHARHGVGGCGATTMCRRAARH